MEELDRDGGLTRRGLNYEHISIMWTRYWMSGKNVQFNTHVTGADYDLVSGKWRVATEDGQIATCRFLIIAAGFAAKRHFPDWKGLDSFKS